MAINTFVDYSNGVGHLRPVKTNTRGPRPIYYDKIFLAELKELIQRGDTIAQMQKILGVSQPTISRAKKYIREGDSKEG